MKRVLSFLKKETVLSAATLLAVLSAFFVPPSAAYLSYIDWRVLGILLSLMLVMAGFQKNGLFDRIGTLLLGRTKNTLQLAGVLVFLCYFSSMAVTNDVALLTFVPFAMLTLQKCGQERLMIPVLALQTIAANLGSMLTPIGNPQNLYLYSLAGMSAGEFIGFMLPYTAFSGVLLLVALLVFGGRGREPVAVVGGEADGGQLPLGKNIAYFVLFALSLLVVGRILPYNLVLAVVLLTVLVIDREVFFRVDYCLLLTFISFFVFIGNLGNIPAVRETFERLVAGRELGIGIAASQFISNVPAALMLSGFTEDYRALLLGVNFGGLGTLIASMASLISYKIYAHNYNGTKGRYLLWFTAANVLFLAALALAEAILGR